MQLIIKQRRQNAQRLWGGGENIIGGCKFHCNYWKETDARRLQRGRAEQLNLFPECRGTVLDVEVLEQLVLTLEILENKDALWA